MNDRIHSIYHMVRLVFATKRLGKITLQTGNKNREMDCRKLYSNPYRRIVFLPKGLLLCSMYVMKGLDQSLSGFVNGSGKLWVIQSSI